MKKLGGSFFLLFFSFFPFITHGEDTLLVKWDFPLAANDDPIADGGIFDNLTQTMSSSGTNPLAVQSSGVLSSSGWTNGANQKFWLIPVTTIGYKDIELTFKIGGSSTGPRDFTIEYRINEETDWRVISQTSIVVPSSSSVYSTPFSFSLPEEATNQNAVFLRILQISNTAVNGGAISSTGTNRLDDIFIMGKPIEDEPEENILCNGVNDQISLSEVLPTPETDAEEYIELFNSGSECVDLSNWEFKDDKNPKIILPHNTIIEGGQYLTFTRNFYLSNTGDTFTVSDDDGVERASIQYPSAPRGYSYSFNGTEWLFTSYQTQGAENIFDEIEEETETPDILEGIFLTEIFPNPLGDEVLGEYIEIYNDTDSEQNLSGWSIRDVSQKTYLFPQNTSIGAKQYFLLPRKDFRFSLNNSGTETITLFNRSGIEISQVEYTGTQENFSFSRNTENGWQWTKKITPGAKNEFSKIPKITLSSGAQGYQNVPLLFQLRVLSEKKSYRYSWDFGDGRKSNLAEPKHTYIENGEYKGSVTLRSSDQVITENFTVVIKKYPKVPVAITRLYPNPEGRDTGNEWVEIENLSFKTLNLKDWRIATGTEDPTPHTLKKDLFIEPGKVARVTREHSLFTLPNTQGIVELRYPDDTLAVKVTFNEESIPEQSVCLIKNGMCFFLESSLSEEKDSVKSTSSEKNVGAKKTALINIHTKTTSPITKEGIAKSLGEDINHFLNQYFLKTP